MENYNTEEFNYRLSKFHNKFDTEPKYFYATWNQIHRSLSKFKDANNKERFGVGLWSGVTFAEGQNRKQENVVSISIVILDFDETISLRELETLSSGFKRIIYTSYSHCEDKEHYRLVMAIPHPVPLSDWPDIWRRLNQMFNGKVCPSTKDASRMFYRPCHSASNCHLSFTKVYDGEILDPYALPEAPTLPTSPKSRKAPRMAGNGLNEGVGDADVNINSGVFISPDKMESLIKRVQGEYALKGITDNSIIEWAVLRSCAKKNLDFSCVRAGFDADVRLSHYQKKVRGNGVDNAVEWLRGDYIRAHIKPDTLAFAENTDKIREMVPILRFLISQQDCWKGRKRDNMRKVLQIHLTVLENCCHEVYNLSSRKCSEMLPEMNWDTCNRHCNSLIDEGWLIGVKKKTKSFKEGRSYGMGPKIIELWEDWINRETGIEINSEIRHISTYKSADGCAYMSEIEKESKGLSASEVAGQTETFGVFYSPDIKKSSEPIWIALHDGPKSIDELVSITHKSKAVVKGAIKRMEKYSIILFIDGVAAMVSDYEFKTLGEDLGTINRRYEKIKKHSIDRAKHDYALEYRRTRISSSSDVIHLSEGFVECLLQQEETDNDFNNIYIDFPESVVIPVSAP